MSRLFAWVDGLRGTARDGDVVWTVMTKPDLGTDYFDVHYEDGAGTIDGLVALSEGQLAVIEEIFSNCPHSNLDEVVPAVDAQGVYLGLQPLPLAAGVTHVPGVPRSTDVRWDFGARAFVHYEDLGASISRALDTIDCAAGTARLRYITDVPGQQGTYLAKAAEADAFVAAGGVGDVPPFIAAEAAATGMEPLAAAQFICATRDVWQGVIGPRIEQLRRYHDEQVKVLTSKAAITTQVATALSELAAV